jgi:hypothetical protein
MTRRCVSISSYAPLAQLDRASGYEPEGREFESLRARHSFGAASFFVSAAFCYFLYNLKR